MSTSLGNDIISIHKLLGWEWEGYGTPTDVDIELAISSMKTYLDDYEGLVSLELPGTHIRLDRNQDGVYNVYLRIGSLDQEINVE